MPVLGPSLAAVRPGVGPLLVLTLGEPKKNLPTAGNYRIDQIRFPDIFVFALARLRERLS